jgi:hypothetical protein
MHNGGNYLTKHIMENLVIQHITPASPERLQVDEFVTAEYLKRMQVSPPLPDIIFAAFRQQEIIGTIGLEFSEQDDDPIPCEHIFVFDWSVLVLPTCRTKAAHYTRWAVTDQGISGKILYAATVYALAQGKECGWCELKPKVAKLLRINLNIILHEVTGAVISLTSVPDSVKSYYTTKPYPQLYQFELSQMAHALQ